MHCNSGYYYVTKDLTIWGLCGFRVGILQFCPVCSLWTSRAVGSAYILEDENLCFAEIESIQDNPSQKCAKRRRSGSKHEGLQCRQ